MTFPNWVFHPKNRGNFPPKWKVYFVENPIRIDDLGGFPPIFENNQLGLGWPGRILEDCGRLVCWIVNPFHSRQMVSTVVWECVVHQSVLFISFYMGGGMCFVSHLAMIDSDLVISLASPRITATTGPPSNQALSLSFPAFSCWSSMLCCLCLWAKNFDTILMFKSCLNKWRVTIYNTDPDPFQVESRKKIHPKNVCHSHFQKSLGIFFYPLHSGSIFQPAMLIYLSVSTQHSTQVTNLRKLGTKNKPLRYVRRAMYAKVKESESSASGTPHWSWHRLSITLKFQSRCWNG